MDIIPFFYYDIVARIIPGVVTLGVVAFAGPNFKDSLSRFLTGSKDWNGILLSLLIGGMAYAIGVLYEALFSIPPLRSYKTLAERKAWKSASLKFDKANGTDYLK